MNFDLSAYRAVLVWVLRIGGFVALVSTLGTLALVLRDTGVNPLPSTTFSIASLLLNVIVFFAVAEILAILNARNNRVDREPTRS
jgi:hypothetical protein